MDWLAEPVKVWHLIVLAMAVGLTLHNFQKQMNAIGKCVFEVWERFHPTTDETDFGGP